MVRPEADIDGSTEPGSAEIDDPARQESADRTSPIIAGTSTPPVTEPKRSGFRDLAPAISPLLIGFALLLVVIFVLGYLSMQRLETLNSEVLDSQRTQAARLRLILDLRLALTILDNEARARHEAEAREGLKPPFDFRLSTARDELEKNAKPLEVPPLSQEERWAAFRKDLQSFIEVTRDLRRYSLEGRTMFEALDKQLNSFLIDKWYERQTELVQETLVKQEQAVDSIKRWILIALLIGTLVAAGTIWEVQRRFRQARQSIVEARRERTFTSQLLEGMVSAVAAIDENNRLRSANAAFLEIFPGAVIGASVFEKIGNDDATKMLAAATETRLTRASYRGRWVIRADGQGEKTFDVYSSPLALDGDQGQIVTLVDATEVAEYERGLRRSESLAAVGQATAQVAHEIRNPLGSIRLGVSMLRDSVKTDEALNTIELVERGISHLNKLVVDVTQFSRQKALERSQVDLHELLDRSLDLISESLSEKRTPVEKEFSDEALSGFWDTHQLQQVFVNLISNAVDASHAESPITISTEEITLNAGSQDAGKKYARIAVSDRGKGIDPTKAERIFEPFFSTKKRGTGLGLAIVKQIVERHDGKISVDSQAGKGTTFTVDLPL